MSNQGETSPTVADQMPALAAEFVQVCKTNGVSLDYLPRTLPLVDRFLNGKRAEMAAEVRTKHCSLITAYLGEVIAAPCAECTTAAVGFIVRFLDAPAVAAP